MLIFECHCTRRLHFPNGKLVKNELKLRLNFSVNKSPNIPLSFANHQSFTLNCIESFWYALIVKEDDIFRIPLFKFTNERCVSEKCANSVE